MRTPGAEGVDNAGDKLYGFSLKALEGWAQVLNLPGAPLARLGGKSNAAAKQERAGDLVEAVLGAPALRKHLEAGGVGGKAEGARYVDSRVPDENAAARLLAVVDGAEDLVEAWKAEGRQEPPDAAEFPYRVLQADAFVKFTEWA